MKINYKNRWDSIQSILGERDAFVSALPGNTRYLANSESPPGSPPSSTMNYVIIPKKGDPVAITSSLEEHRCRHESSVKDIRCWSTYPDIESEGKNSLDVLKSTLSDIKAKKIFADSKIRLGRSFGVSVNAKISELRSIKSPEEISRIRKAVKHSDSGQSFAHNLVEAGEGLTEKEIRCEIDYFMARKGVQENSFGTIVASGPNAAHSHHSNTDRKLELGDPVICDFGVFWDGYCSDITRTYFVGGSPSEEWKKIYNIVLEANKRSTKALIEGSTGHKVDKAGRDFIRKKGFGANFVHGTGHGFGLEIHEYPSITYKSRVQIKNSMAVTIEPGIYLPGKGGIRIEDDVLPHGSEPKVLTEAEKEIY
ncbi:MAG: M24 family metallopeptidase [Candidatus Thermoplasmatota archaeon]|nr:M24 family metallopeptidase [Candidatus Thermoplasmatota archaeon]